MAALDGDVLIHKYELFNKMAVALAELQTGLRDRMTPKDILGMILEAEPVDPVKHGRWMAHDSSIKDVPIEACSVCYEWSYGYNENYCSHCGAMMD